MHVFLCLTIFVSIFSPGTDPASQHLDVLATGAAVELVDSVVSPAHGVSHLCLILHMHAEVDSVHTEHLLEHPQTHSGFGSAAHKTNIQLGFYAAQSLIVAQAYSHLQWIAHHKQHLDTSGKKVETDELVEILNVGIVGDDTIISISFFSTVPSVQHLISFLGDYSHSWPGGWHSNFRHTDRQMSRDRQMDNTRSSVYSNATSLPSEPTF